jgi:hypothetical protein
VTEDLTGGERIAVAGGEGQLDARVDQGEDAHRRRGTGQDAGGTGDEPSAAGALRLDRRRRGDVSGRQILLEGEEEQAVEPGREGPRRNGRLSRRRR